MSDPPRRDTIVMGCSAGGLTALQHILRTFPIELAATVIVVQHLAPEGGHYLVELLRRHSKLPVRWAEQGERTEPGTVYVAPADHHLLLADGHLMLSRGPRENHARPSIDKLFRSAAATRDGRTIGVLLTGMLGDGVAGLAAIQRAGGATIAEDPRSAEFPEMPSRAIRAGAADQVLPLDQIAQAILTLTGQPVRRSAARVDLVREAALDRAGPTTPDEMHTLGSQTALMCPECGGPLWRLGDSGERHFRCYLGHAQSASVWLADSARDIENALGRVMRGLGDRAAALEILADDAGRIGDQEAALDLERTLGAAREDLARTHAFTLELLFRGHGTRRAR